MNDNTIPSMYPEFTEQNTPPERGEHGYYKMGKNFGYRTGWVITAPVWPTYKADMEYKGLTYLPQYGTFIMTGPGGLRTKDAKGYLWNPADEPWRNILQLGGAKEFPISQIVAFRWHIRQPYREAKFEQLEGVDIVDYQCPECEKVGFFSSADKSEAAEMLRTHLISGINSRHNYTMVDLRELGKEYEIDFAIRRRIHKPTNVSIIKQTVIELPVEDKWEPIEVVGQEEYRCSECGWMPLPNKVPVQAAAALRMHKRHCKGKPVEVLDAVS